MYLKVYFQICSNNLDCKLSVKELVESYLHVGYDIITITNHDTMEGCKEVVEYGNIK